MAKLRDSYIAASLDYIQPYSIFLGTLCIITVFVLFYCWNDTLRANWILFLAVKRGIVSQNCFWWKISDFFSDSMGIALYNKLKKQYGDFAPVNLFGTHMYLVSGEDKIRTILENSPFLFGVGIKKKQFFQSFMEDNVGVSNGCPWKRRRAFNDVVLHADQPFHPYRVHFAQAIRDILRAHKLPQNYDEFTTTAKRIAMKIVLNADEIYEPLFQVFHQANSVRALLYETNDVVAADLKKQSTDYIRTALQNPKPNSLMQLAAEHSALLSDEKERMDQVPHWIFPIVGLISVSVPRLLAILLNDERVFHTLKKKLAEEGDNTPYLRKCILELFRINNPVNSTFRTLLQDYRFEDGHTFAKGTQFLIFNNPVMRDLFDRPAEYIPERWTAELETATRALMFNQSNQRCPGKELALFIFQHAIRTYLELSTQNLKTNMVITTGHITEFINPCKITFNL